MPGRIRHAAANPGSEAAKAAKAAKAVTHPLAISAPKLATLVPKPDHLAKSK